MEACGECAPAPTAGSGRESFKQLVFSKGQVRYVLDRASFTLNRDRLVDCGRASGYAICVLLAAQACPDIACAPR